MKKIVFVVLACVGLPMSFLGQATQPKAGVPAAAPTRARQAASPQATMAQLMKGIFFPGSNVVFAAQSVNPAEVAPAKDPSLATDPLASTYGKWEAVENSALALGEAAALLTVPGRKCSNGLTAPSANADWIRFTQGLREAAALTYQAAKARDQDKIIDAADKLTTACGDCHERYREKPSLAERCK